MWWIIPCIALGIPLLYILVITFSALLVDTKKEYRRNSRFYRFLLNGSTAIALWLCRIHVHTTGLEKLPKEGHFLIVSNHRSNFDPIITWHVLRRYNVAFVSKPENFKIPIFGRIIRKCCFMEIDRTSPRKSLMTLYSAVDILKQGDMSVGIYPEGTRSKSGELLPFHNGIFLVAQKAAENIVVTIIRGTEQIHNNTPFKKTDVYFDVVEVIDAAKVTATPRNDIGDLVRAVMENALTEPLATCPNE